MAHEAEGRPREIIDAVLASRRIAVVGVSRERNHFSRHVLRELLRRGYDAVPVNPEVGEIEGLACAASVADVVPVAEAAVVMTPPDRSAEVVEECAAAGVPLVWLYRKRSGAEAPDGVRMVEGYCPLMFLPDAGFIHRFHAFLAKLAGTYPR